jgi:electron transfer flavoprotein alpha subunit
VTAANLSELETIAVVVIRDGRAPEGADEAIAEAEGRAVLVGNNPVSAAPNLPSTAQAWWAEADPAPAQMASRLAGVLDLVPLVILPGSPDGRDLAPRLAAAMGRPLLGGASRCWLEDGLPAADLLRVDGQVVIPAMASEPAVATLLPGARGSEPADEPPVLIALELPLPAGAAFDPRVLAIIEPDPATMDLADATRVVGGGAGLVPPGASVAQARALFALMIEVSAALGASAGATRVVTDAGWMDYDRQIGTTGVSIDPDLYVALGVSGASQHIGGLGNPSSTVSVNIDPSCPMTSMSELGLITDAASLLVELARRLDISLPAEVAELCVPQGTR